MLKEQKVETDLLEGEEYKDEKKVSISTPVRRQSEEFFEKKLILEKISRRQKTYKITHNAKSYLTNQTKSNYPLNILQKQGLPWQPTL